MNKVKSSLWSCVLISLAFLLVQSSCQKQKFLTNGGSIRFDEDTLKFDTVFTTQGSVTKWLLLKNENDKWISVNNIRLEKGDTSVFRLNVDGQATKNISNIEIAPRDSIYVFVAVTINPNNANNPFVMEDKILATFNGTQKEVFLSAYGQNAIYINDSVLQGNITWTNTKPYVVINSALVDSDAVLNIQPGARIYMHANSKLFLKGTLKAIGTKTDSIIFVGDRLDRDYFGGDIAGEWCGLHFLNNSMNNELRYCIIKNGGAPWKVYNPTTYDYDYLTGALVYVQPNPTGNTNTKLSISNCFIGMSIAHGILAFNARIRIDNTLLYTCGAQNFYALEGGTYNLNYVTMGNYGHRFLRHDKEPILALRNYLPNPDPSKITGNSLVANFTNCIVDGNATEGNECFLDNYNIYPYSANFYSCILKQKDAITPSEAILDTKTAALRNAAVKFKDPVKQDFSLESSSNAFGNGQVIPGISIDLLDKPRSATPTIGCYE
jgi:hypothetical protein